MATVGADSKPTPVVPILIAMLAGALIGWWLGPDGAIGGFKLLPLFDPVGTMFINLLKMLIVPLILASVITGVASLGTGPDLGRLGGKTLGFYVMTTLIAVLIALMLVNVVEPGVRDGQPVKDAAGAHRRRRRSHRGRHASRRDQRARFDQGNRAREHRRRRAEHQDDRPGAVLHPVRVFPGAHRRSRIATTCTASGRACS